jgi:hypothetical protein
MLYRQANKIAVGKAKRTLLLLALLVSLFSSAGVAGTALPKSDLLLSGRLITASPLKSAARYKSALIKVYKRPFPLMPTASAAAAYDRRITIQYQLFKNRVIAPFALVFVYRSHLPHCADDAPSFSPFLA